MIRIVVNNRLILLFAVVAMVAVACSGGEDRAAADLPSADANALMTYVNETNNYEQWGTWPADEWNDFDQLLVSGAPHGGVVRIYVNDTGLQAADSFDGALPEGTIIVKENYTGASPDSPGDLDALTIMYKVDGFNAEGGDWFWVKAKPDGSTIDAEGAVAGCIGCHSQQNNKDFVLRYGFGEEPAVTSLQEAASN